MTTLWYMFKSALPAAFPNWAFWLSGKNIPSLNVLRPTASTLDTSSYVKVPAIPTSPVTVRVPPIDTLPLNVPCPVTLKISSIVVVPPAESIVKSPD